MMMPVIPILTDALETVHKQLERELLELENGGKLETIKPTALLGSVSMLRKVQEIRGDLLSLGRNNKSIR